MILSWGPAWLKLLLCWLLRASSWSTFHFAKNYPCCCIVRSVPPNTYCRACNATAEGEENVSGAMRISIGGCSQAVGAYAWGEIVGTCDGFVGILPEDVPDEFLFAANQCGQGVANCFYHNGLPGLQPDAFLRCPEAKDASHPDCNNINGNWLALADIRRINPVPDPPDPPFWLDPHGGVLSAVNRSSSIPFRCLWRSFLEGPLTTPHPGYYNGSTCGNAGQAPGCGCVGQVLNGLQAEFQLEIVSPAKTPFQTDRLLDGGGFYVRGEATVTVRSPTGRIAARSDPGQCDGSSIDWTHYRADTAWELYGNPFLELRDVDSYEAATGPVSAYTGFRENWRMKPSDPGYADPLPANPPWDFHYDCDQTTWTLTSPVRPIFRGGAIPGDPGGTDLWRVWHTHDFGEGAGVYEFRDIENQAASLIHNPSNPILDPRTGELVPSKGCPGFCGPTGLSVLPRYHRDCDYRTASATVSQISIPPWVGDYFALLEDDWFRVANSSLAETSSDSYGAEAMTP